MGSEVRVAIIDSGVHVTHPHIGRVAGGIGIGDDGQPHPDFIDRLGHGTAVTAAIHEKAPQAELWAVKVFDRELRATGTALVAALTWARQADMHVVNLSLGTTNPDHEDALRREVEACHAAGIVIVAAAPEPGSRWLPGALPGVVGVTLDTTCPREEGTLLSHGAEAVRVGASGYPRPIPGVPVERNLQGLSFAVANATGLVARAWPEWASALRLPSDR